jgi:hypothetical protein
MLSSCTHTAPEEEVVPHVCSLRMGRGAGGREERSSTSRITLRMCRGAHVERCACIRMPLPVVRSSSACCARPPASVLNRCAHPRLSFAC